MSEPVPTMPIEPASLQQGITGKDGIPTLHAGVTPQSSSNKATPATGTSSSTDTPAATAVRQRLSNLSAQVDAATDHPAVQNAKVTAQKQVGNIREFLGRSPLLVEAEKRTKVDRVILFVGGIIAYIAVIPFNFLSLALPVTTLLTLVPPSFIALGILEQRGSEANEAATRALLSYFVALGFVQFLESLAAGVLYSWIPQYYTLKLAFMAYLLHPKTQGAMKIHNSVFRPLFIRSSGAATTTPPTAHASYSSGSSPTGPNAGSPPVTAVGGTKLPVE